MAQKRRRIRTERERPEGEQPDVGASVYPYIPWLRCKAVVLVAPTEHAFPLKFLYGWLSRACLGSTTTIILVYYGAQRRRFSAAAPSAQRFVDLFVCQLIAAVSSQLYYVATTD